MDRVMEWCSKRPLFYPIVAFANTMHALFYQFPLWLMGYWLCDGCGKKQKPDEPKVYMQWGETCRNCNKNH